MQFRFVAQHFSPRNQGRRLVPRATVRTLLSMGGIVNSSRVLNHRFCRLPYNQPLHRTPSAAEAAASCAGERRRYGEQRTP